MKFKFTLLIIILMNAATGFAMQNDQLCTLPKAEILKQRFKGFKHFIEKTQLIELVAGKKLAPLGVALALSTAIIDYSHYITQEAPGYLIRSQQAQIAACKPLFLELLLKDYPSALVKLRQAGVYQPTAKL